MLMTSARDPNGWRALATALVIAACSSRAKPVEPTGNADGTLAFEIADGNIRNYFFRHGPVAAHVLVSSGAEPRLVVAFPAGNTGVGVWFGKVAAPVAFAVDGRVEGT